MMSLGSTFVDMSVSVVSRLFRLPNSMAAKHLHQSNPQMDRSRPVLPFCSAINLVVAGSGYELFCARIVFWAGSADFSLAGSAPPNGRVSARDIFRPPFRRTMLS